MADLDSDILEIAVHGTQFVRIKDEIDPLGEEDAVIKRSSALNPQMDFEQAVLEESLTFIPQNKDEDEETHELSTFKLEIDVDGDEDAIIGGSTWAQFYDDDEDTLQRRLLASEPLVYTTRLDDMKVFKSNIANIKKVTDVVLNESKPRYIQTHPKIKRQPLNGERIASYIQLYNRIQLNNAKIKIQKRENAKLLKQCKPLKVVLEDINKCNKLKFTVNTASIDQSSDDDDLRLSDLLSSLHSKAGTVRKVSPGHQNNFKLKGGSFRESLAFMSKQSNMYDVYEISLSKGIEMHLKLTTEDYNAYQSSQRSIKHSFYRYCCWARKEKLILKYIQTLPFTVYKSSISNFLRIPHTCRLGECACCCKTSVVRKKEYNNEDVIRKNIDPGSDHSTLHMDGIIKKALTYSTPEVAKPLPRPIYRTNTAVPSIVIMNYQGVMLKQTQKFGENYEIGWSGHITTYLSPNDNITLTEQMARCRKRDKEIGVNRMCYCKIICCWYKREKFIREQLHKLEQTVQKFIRTPHLCASVCECCCKPENKQLISIMNKDILRAQDNVPVQIQVPSIILTQQCQNALGQNMPAEKIGTNVSEVVSTKSFTGNVTQEATKGGITDNFDSYDLTNDDISRYASSSEIILDEGTTPVPRALNDNPDNFISRSVQYNIDLARNANVSNSPVIHGLSVTNIGSSSKTHNVSISNQVPEGLEPILNGVLDKFKNLKLDVNDQGKLTALIDACPVTLNTVEIKVLSDILSLASVQIAQLGITAKEFCERVNASRANDQTGLAVPKLVPIVPKKSVKPRNTVTPKPKPTAPSAIACTKPNYLQHRQLPARLNINTDNVTNIYKSMSELGSAKNLHLVCAYLTYFSDMALWADNIKIVEKSKVLEKRQRLTKRQNPMLTTITNKKTRVGSPTRSTNVLQCQQPLFYPQIAQNPGNIPLLKLNPPTLTPVMGACDSGTQTLKNFLLVPPVLVTDSFLRTATTQPMNNCATNIETQLNNNIVSNAGTQSIINNSIPVITGKNPGAIGTAYNTCVPHGNSLLFQMLSKPTKMPPVSVGLKTAHLGLPRITPVNPVINSEPKRKQLKRSNEIVTHSHVSDANDIDGVAKRSTKPQQETVETIVNSNPISIDDDHDVQCIFGT